MAETLVLIPGPMMDTRIFLPQMLALQGLCPVLLPRRTLRSSIEDLADEVLNDAPARFAAMGHGTGGMVAMELLRRAPERIARVVLIATDPLTDAAAVSVARDEAVVQARSGRFAATIAADPAVADYAARGDCDDLAAALTDMALARGAEGFAVHVRALQRRPDQQRVLRQARVPALVIGGGADPVHPARRQEFVAGLIRGARSMIVPGAGHLPTLEAPDAVNAALVQFLGDGVEAAVATA
jgi:pimeloyl-ACP methyl ester carboxylesterase